MIPYKKQVFLLFWSCRGNIEYSTTWRLRDGVNSFNDKYSFRVRKQYTSFDRNNIRMLSAVCVTGFVQRGAVKMTSYWYLIHLYLVTRYRETISVLP